MLLQGQPWTLRDPSENPHFPTSQWLGILSPFLARDTHIISCPLPVTPLKLQLVCSFSSALLVTFYFESPLHT